MKFILTILTACCITFPASAGSHFKTIHFTSYWSETQKSGLDMQFGSSPVAGMSSRVEGDIIINTEDSTLSIGAEDSTPSVYKMTRTDEESDDKSRQIRTLDLQIKDKDGATYGVTVKRDYQYRLMWVYIFPKGSDTYRVYGCKYLKKFN